MPEWRTVRREPRVKILNGVPDHEAYRAKLRAKWQRKGYTEVRFCA